MKQSASRANEKNMRDPFAAPQDVCMSVYSIHTKRSSSLKLAGRRCMEVSF